jgi:hypothetical protein
MHPTLYQQLLGPSFSGLPEKLRALHGVHCRTTWAGRADVVRGDGLVARLCATIAGLPPAMRDAPTRVEFISDHSGEAWNRSFGGHGMASRLSAHDGLLRERLGPILFHFELVVANGEITWQVRSVRALGLPLPARLFRGVRCREREWQGRYEFSVEAALPWVGLLVRYEGWLEPCTTRSNVSPSPTGSIAISTRGSR